MKLIFDKPLIPNFIRTNRGLFDIKVLSESELQEYISLWKLTLIDNWQKRKQEEDKK